MADSNDVACIDFTQEGSDAWEASPDKALRLKMKDIKQSLKDRWLQLFWPEDGRWWPGQVIEVHAKERKISLLYKTGACPHACCPIW